MIRCFALRTEVLLALSIALLSGCGKQEAGPSGQTAVLVNRQEVSVHQLQHVLQRQSRLAVEHPDVAARRALDALVEQELAAQAAREAGLDKDPRFVQALEVSRRELLARAWQDQLAEKAVGPTSDAVDRYYDTHPALFAQRRLYTLQETAVQADAPLRDKLQQLAKTARDPKEFTDLMKSAGRVSRTRQFVQAAEDLPMGLVDVLGRFESGQSVVVGGADTTRIITVVSYQVAPLDKQAAKDAIEAHLTNLQRRKLVAEGMKVQREKASIQYAAAFASATASTAEAAKAP